MEKTAGEMRKKWVDRLYIFMAIIPALFTIAWCVMNTQLPVADGSDSISVVSKLYSGFQDKSLFHALLSLYTDRGWRPVVFPLFMLPFMFISKGSLLFSYTSVSALAMFLGTVYTYLLLNLGITRSSSMIGACVIGCLPLLQMLGLKVFYTEVALFPCLFALIYHLVKSDFLQDSRHSKAVILFLALALTLRPVEVTLHLILPMSYFFYLGVKKKIFTLRDIHIAVTLMMLGITVLMAFGIHVSMKDNFVINKDPEMGIAYVYIITATTLGALALLVGLYWREMKRCFVAISKLLHIESGKHALFPVIFFATLFTVAWWAPYIQRLTEWTYITSIGGLAKGLPKEASQNVLKNILHSEGVLTFSLVGLTVLIAMFSIPLKKIKVIVSSPLFIYPILMLPVPLLVTLFSIQTTMRKIALALPFLLVALMLIGLANGRFWRLRNAIIFILLSCQIVALICLYLDFDVGRSASKNKFITLTGMNGIPQPVIFRPNPHDVTLAFLSENAKKYHLKNIAAQISAEYKVTVDPFLLLTMGHVYNSNFSINYPYYDQFSRDNELKIAHDNDGMLLIYPFGKDASSSNLSDEYAKIAMKSTPWERITFDTMAQDAAGTINTLGWVKGPCYTFKMDKDYEGCLFLKASTVA